MTRSNSPSPTIAIGVIGCGRLARAVHLPNLARLPGARVIALADVDATQLSEAGAWAPRARRLADYPRLLEMAELDAVLVCVPPALHADVAIAALEAGKHVYLEKPLATTLEDGRRICEAWRRSGRVGMVGFNYRFNRQYRQAQIHLASGRIGPAVAVRSVFAASPKWLPQWKRSLSTGGGALLDLASHEIDLVRFVLGQEVIEVLADVRGLESEGDSAVLQMRLADRVPVQIFVSLRTAEEAVFEVFGQRGKVTVNRYQGVAARLAGPRVRGRLRDLCHSLKAVRDLPYFIQRLRARAHEPSHAAALAHFFGAIRGCHHAGPDFLDGYRSLAVVCAAETSAGTGRPTAIDRACPSLPSDRGVSGTAWSYGHRSEMP
jgi:predicted dehydrogenase